MFVHGTYISHTDHGMHVGVEDNFVESIIFCFISFALVQGWTQIARLPKQKYLTGEPSAPVTCFLSNNSYSHLLDLKSQNTFNLVF